MKHFNTLKLAALFVMAAVLTSGSLSAQTCDSTGVRQGNARWNYVDANGDGYNDNAPDHDGDGIPNGRDADYNRTGGRGRGFIDADGDGINDRIRDNDGDGIANGRDSDFVRPRDGSGSGRGRGFDRGNRCGSGAGQRGGRGGKR